MSLVLAMCSESLQWENPQRKIGVFNCKQGEGRMKEISSEYVRQATAMRVRKSKILNKYKSNSD